MRRSRISGSARSDDGISIGSVRRQRMEARRNAGKNMSGDAVAHAINPKHPFRDSLYVKQPAMSARDHQRQNRKKIREIEHSFKQRQIEAEQQSRKPKFRMRKFSNVGAKISSTTGDDVEGETRKHDFLRKDSGRSRRLRLGHKEGEGNDAPPPPSPPPGAAAARASSKPGVPSHHVSRPSGPRSATNFVARNLKEAISLNPPRKPETAEPAITDRAGFGRVPLYIHQRKFELATKEKAKRMEKERERLPPGMTLMAEEERQKTVELLTQNKEKITREISSMPLTIETPTLVEKHNMLHEKLREIEEAMKLFTRKKVYITAD